MMAATIETDAWVLKNQPVAKEGVLQYGTIGALKQWRDLENNIGRRVPILDEHPKRDNGRDGLHNGEKTHGWATLKACPAGEKKLCADMRFDDDAPAKSGYSVGFLYEQVKQDGEHSGKRFHEVQSNLWIDHVAMTDTPRDETALQVLADAAKLKAWQDSLPAGTGPAPSIAGPAAVFKLALAHDSHVMSDARLDAIRKSLREKNPAWDDATVEKRAVIMYMNEQKLQSSTGDTESAMPEQHEKGAPAPVIVADSTALDAANKRIAALEEALQKERDAKVAESDAKLKALDARVVELTKTVAARDAALEKVLDELEAYQDKELKARTDAVFAKTKLDTKAREAFDKMPLEALDYVEKLVNLISITDPPAGTPVPKGDAKAGDGTKQAADAMPEREFTETSTIGKRWSHAQQKYVPTDQFNLREG